MPTMKNILVTGATGNQGGAVIDALLRENEEKGAQEWKIFALTRSASGGKAKQLVTKGKGAVELVEGDLNDAKFMSSWVTPEKDLYAIFAVTMMGKGETEQGILIADQALKAGVKHYIYTSVEGAERKTGVPHFETKWLVEEHIRKIGIPYTILRPVCFMNNFTTPGMFGKVSTGFYQHYVKEPKKLQLIAPSDIGKMAAITLQRPEEYKGQVISMAGDELTFTEANEIYKKYHDGADIPASGSFMVTLIGWMSAELRLMFKWFAAEGYNSDIAALRKTLPNLETFEDFMKGLTKE